MEVVWGLEVKAVMRRRAAQARIAVMMMEAATNPRPKGDWASFSLIGFLLSPVPD
ncbi:hypothetical protein [Streptomyces sp. SID13031]|uniref:hypothetical protein n=1 Tax=Streptomyces sp. SID13031 TaxID=2706046 RepID=UPI0013CDA4C7|nr:hypothetical protein [Streptomyces sp. SID13031]NEA33196.1 hypothetical protein [Streptomyces sp. SID13031]